VRVEFKKMLMQGVIAGPKVGPESRRNPIANGDLGDGVKDPESGNNVLPYGGVVVVRVAEVPRVIPVVPTTEPGSPGSSGVGVKFSEEFSE
jgi:hypothetical protein